VRVMDLPENMKLRHTDFESDKYCGYCCCNRKGLSPVLLMVSKSSDPPHWLIVDGTRQMFYLSYKEAIEHLKNKGYLV